MTRFFALALVVAAIMAATVPARAEDVNLNFYPASARYLDKDYWDPVETQYAFGGTVDFGKSGWPVHLAFGLNGSAGVKDLNNPFADQVTAVINELSFGVAKVWTTQGNVRPFLSGGVSFVHVDYEVDTFVGTTDDNDDSIGGWIEGGVYWRLTPHFNFGLFGRTLLGTSITLFGVDGDADYWEFGPMLGWSWPPKK